MWIKSMSSVSEFVIFMVKLLIGIHKEKSWPYTLLLYNLASFKICQKKALFKRLYAIAAQNSPSREIFHDAPLLNY